MTQTDPTLRPELAAFAELQERVLKKNDWKGGWQTMTVRQMLWRLHEEVLELHEASVAWDTRSAAPLLDQGPERVCIEAADVANFAMFIAERVAKRSGIALEDVQP